MQDSAILEISNPGDNEDATAQLQFQTFVPTSTSSASYLSGLPHTQAEISQDEEEDVLLGEPKQTKSGLNMWEISYFARYFDVTTNQVLARILWSLMPIVNKGHKGNYIERHIQPNPDMYGPFWISVTLVFSIAIFGNISNYLNNWDPDKDWHYDFRKVGLAGTTIFSYVLIVPFTLWFFFWFRGCTVCYTLLETICAYGYSLSIYVPISILWVINIWSVQITFVVVGALLSGSVLFISFAPVVHSDPAKTVKLSYFILLLIVAMHALLAFSFLTYFF